MARTLLLKAEEHNWGLMHRGDWDKTVWRIYSDGSYVITKSFSPSDRSVPAKSLSTEGNLTDTKFQELKLLLEAEWSTEEHKCCDGVAWRLTMYDRGTVIKQRPFGYIYDIEPYEDYYTYSSSIQREKSQHIRLVIFWLLTNTRLWILCFLYGFCGCSRFFC